LNIRFEADFRTAPGAIVGVVAVFIAVDVVGVFLAVVVVVIVNFLDGVVIVVVDFFDDGVVVAVVVAVDIFLVIVDFSFPLSLLTASSSLDKAGSEKLARLKWSNSGGKRFVPRKRRI